MRRLDGQPRSDKGGKHVWRSNDGYERYMKSRCRAITCIETGEIWTSSSEASRTLSVRFKTSNVNSLRLKICRSIWEDRPVANEDGTLIYHFAYADGNGKRPYKKSDNITIKADEEPETIIYVFKRSVEEDAE